MSLIWDRCFHRRRPGRPGDSLGLYTLRQSTEMGSARRREEGQERRGGKNGQTTGLVSCWNHPEVEDPRIPSSSLAQLPGESVTGLLGRPWPQQSSLPAALARAWGAGRLLVLFRWRTEPLFFLQVLLQANCPPHGERWGPLQPLCGGRASTPVLLPPPPHLLPAPCPWGPSCTFWIIRGLSSPGSAVLLVVPPRTEHGASGAGETSAERENLEKG